MATIHAGITKAPSLSHKDSIRYQMELLRNTVDAAKEMVLAAKEATPPKWDAPNRGRNTFTGALADSWRYRVRMNQDGSIDVLLSNNMPYASFVNDGHKMNQHFVPWLYVDSSGFLSRHKPISGEQLFGLVVGNKTKYVPGADMVGQAEDRFNEVFDRLMAKTNAKFGIL